MLISTHALINKHKPATMHYPSLNYHLTPSKSRALSHKCWRRRGPQALVCLAPLAAVFVDPVKQVSLANIRNWENMEKLQSVRTFCGKQSTAWTNTWQYDNSWQLAALSRLWTDCHQLICELNIKQRDLKVYTRIQRNSINQFQQHLSRSFLQEWHAARIEWPCMTAKENVNIHA